MVHCCRSFEAFEDLFEILLVFFSIKTKFLTLNLLFKRKIGKNCDSQQEPINCTFILSKSKPILIIFVTGSPDALFVELGPNMYVKLLAIFTRQNICVTLRINILLP